MGSMKLLVLAATLAASQLASGAVAHAQTDGGERLSTVDSNANPFGPLLPRNVPVDVRGVQAVCTGLDPATRDDPRWEAYPLKLEFHGADGRLVAFAQVSIRDMRGRNIVSVRCPSSWLLLGLPAGDYKASVAAPQGALDDVGFVVPRKGQKSVMVRLAPNVTLGYRP
jgi:hypothetical protein